MCSTVYSNSIFEIVKRLRAIKDVHEGKNKCRDATKGTLEKGQFDYHFSHKKGSEKFKKGSARKNFRVFSTSYP